LLDIAADLNAARPISSGGTGASDAPTALANLGLTATAAELNILDGVTATAAQINKSSTIADNAPGSAPIYACRAWVNFNGVSGATIRESGNVSSVTRNADGAYTVNLATAMPDANFATVISGDRTGNNSNTFSDHNLYTGGFSLSTTSARVYGYGVSAFSDQAHFNVSIFR
jgi:hypothetical protein